MNGSRCKNKAFHGSIAICCAPKSPSKLTYCTLNALSNSLGRRGLEGGVQAVMASPSRVDRWLHHEVVLSSQEEVCYQWAEFTLVPSRVLVCHPVFYHGITGQEGLHQTWPHTPLELTPINHDTIVCEPPGSGIPLQQCKTDQGATYLKLKQ